VKLKKKDKVLPRGKSNESFKILNFDDLVFENRNREYGAYQLRKRYNNTLITGTIIASLIVCAIVIIPFLSVRKSEHVIYGGNGYVQVKMENLQQPEEKVYVPPAPPAPPTTKIPETVKYVPPVVVDSVNPMDQSPITNDMALASKDRELIDTTGTGGFGDDLLSGGEGTVGEEPLFIVEVMPTFKGGDLNKFRDWVGKRTNYPQTAIDNNIKGTVILTFIVEKDGSVSNVKVTKGVDPLLDNEAVKAISESPKWTPGLQRGQPVRVRFIIPLTFI
jgi:periplasmic protein TonB